MTKESSCYYFLDLHIVSEFDGENHFGDVLLGSRNFRGDAADLFVPSPNSATI